jgi:hypothetical protein
LALKKRRNFEKTIQHILQDKRFNSTITQDATMLNLIDVQKGGTIGRKQLLLMVVHDGNVFKGEWIMELCQWQKHKARESGRRARQMG